MKNRQKMIVRNRMAMRTIRKMAHSVRGSGTERRKQKSHAQCISKNCCQGYRTLQLLYYFHWLCPKLCNATWVSFLEMCSGYIGDASLWKYTDNIGMYMVCCHGSIRVYISRWRGNIRTPRAERAWRLMDVLWHSACTETARRTLPRGPGLSPSAWIWLG